MGPQQKTPAAEWMRLGATDRAVEPGDGARGRTARSVTPIIDVAAIRWAPLSDVPFRWADIRGAVADAGTLADVFPARGFTPHVRLDGDKPYRLEHRPLIALDESFVALDDLDRIWTRVADELRAPAYRRAVAALSEVDLSAAELGAAFWRYPADGFLAPHRDEPHKLVSHVIYFNREWRPDWGGALRILDGGAGGARAEVLPRAGSSVVIVRDERSWHSVAAVTGPDAAPRQSVQVVFYAPGFRHREARVT